VSAAVGEQQDQGDHRDEPDRDQRERPDDDHEDRYEGDERLGRRRLLLHIRDVMHSGDTVPTVPADATLGEALVEMSRKRLGMTADGRAGQKLLKALRDGR